MRKIIVILITMLAVTYGFAGIVTVALAWLLGVTDWNAILIGTGMGGTLMMYQSYQGFLRNEEKKE